jgi:hypothetical protein
MGDNTVRKKGDMGRVNDEHKVKGGAGVDGLNKGPKG